MGGPDPSPYVEKVDLLAGAIPIVFYGMVAFSARLSFPLCLPPFSDKPPPTKTPFPAAGFFFPPSSHPSWALQEFLHS